jgi:hypothetical protein
LAIGADGYIAATATEAYEGRRVAGARTVGLSPPSPRNITHVGDDQVFQLDVLPPNTALTGTLTVGKIDDTLDEMLTDQTAFQIGEANMFGVATNKQGDEKDVVLLIFYQTRDTDPGSSNMGERLWEGLLFPKARLVPQPPPPNANAPVDQVYNVVPNYVSAHAWGTAFVEGTEGFTRAQAIRMVTKYKPKLVSFKGDNSCTDFLFPTDYQSADTNKVAVFIDGVEQTQDMTVLLTGVTFATAPITDANIDVLYEYD